MTLGVVEEWRGVSSVRAVDGTEAEDRGSSGMEMVSRGMQLKLHVIVIDRVVDKIDVVMGMDDIVHLGGVMVSEADIVFGDVGMQCAVSQ